MYDLTGYNIVLLILIYTYDLRYKILNYVIKTHYDSVIIKLKIILYTVIKLYTFEIIIVILKLNKISSNLILNICVFNLVNRFFECKYRL